MNPARPVSTSTIAGVVLAGGTSRRMNRDKAAIPVDGTAQVRRLARLLARFCDPVLVSVSQGSAARALYRGLRTVEDRIPNAGPLCGIVSAHLVLPNAALAIVAVDLFGLDEKVIEALVTFRREAAAVRDGPLQRPAAVAVMSDDGGPEPLCAIWEPSLLVAARDELERGARSARTIMRRWEISLLHVPVGSLGNANTTEELHRFQREMDRSTAHFPETLSFSIMTEGASKPPGVSSRRSADFAASRKARSKKLPATTALRTG